jgi:hypothetical protein
MWCKIACIESKVKEEVPEDELRKEVELSADGR